MTQVRRVVKVFLASLGFGIPNDACHVRLGFQGPL